MKVSKALTVVAFGLLSSSSVAAQDWVAPDVRFLGVTQGCFYTSGPCEPSTSATLLDLTFDGGSFDGVSTNGQLPVSGSVGNLGTFTLGTTPQSYYVGARFLLNIMFALPTMSDPNAFFTAAVRGTVWQWPTYLHIEFDDPQSYEFSGPDFPGAFTIAVTPQQVNVLAGAGAVPITAVITVTPEPASLVLLAGGLAGLIPAARRRFRKKTS